MTRARGVLLALMFLLPASRALAADGFSSVAGRTLSSVHWSVDGPVNVARLESETGWHAGVVLDQARWRALAEGVARAGAAAGYLSAHVTRLTFDDAGGKLAASVGVEAGEPCKLGRVDLYGVRDADSVAARRALGWSSGEAWSEEKLSAGLSRLVNSLVEAGHPFAQARLKKLDVAESRADIEIAVLQGDSAVVDSVHLAGSHRTRPTVVKHAIAGLAGEPYDPRRADEARTRLLHLGTFATVGEPHFELTSPGRGLLRYDVAEGRPSSFDGVVGYQGQGHSLAGTARLLLENIGGSARRAELSWQGRGAGNADFLLSYREPFLFGLPIATGLTFTQSLADSQYTKTDYDLGFEVTAGEGLAVALGLGGGRVVTDQGTVRRSNRQRTWASLTKETEGWRLDGSSGRRPAARFELNTSQESLRDHSVDGTLAHDRLYSIALASQLASPWGNRLARVGLGGALRLADRQSLSQYDLYPLGGAESLRGYREHQFYASRYALLRLEHGWRAGDGDVFVFLDQAVFDHPEGDLSDSTGGSETRYRAGYGFGAWLPMSVGRAGISVGWGRGDGPLDAKLHLTLKSQF
jgi:outer membrane protein assembly factor BamA